MVAEQVEGVGWCGFVCAGGLVRGRRLQVLRWRCAPEGGTEWRRAIYGGWVGGWMVGGWVAGWWVGEWLVSGLGGG